MNNPNNVGEDIDNLNEELMGKWRKGLKNIKHSSIGGKNMNHYEDEIYHSAYSDGYYDGYYAGMELYHADDPEMTEEERRARRKKRRRNVALGAAGIAGAGAAGYAIGRALRKRGRGIVPTGSTGSNWPRLIGGPSGPRRPGPRRPSPTGPSPTGPSPTGPRRIGGPILKRAYGHAEEPIGWDFKKNKPRYMDDEVNEALYRAHAADKYFTEYDHDKKKWVRRDSTSYRH